MVVGAVGTLDLGGQPRRLRLVSDKFPAQRHPLEAGVLVQILGVLQMRVDGRQQDGQGGQALLTVDDLQNGAAEGVLGPAEGDDGSQEVLVL